MVTSLTDSDLSVIISLISIARTYNLLLKLMAMIIY